MYGLYHIWLEDLTELIISKGVTQLQNKQTKHEGIT